MVQKNAEIRSTVGEERHVVWRATRGVDSAWEALLRRFKVVVAPDSVEILVELRAVGL